MPRMGASMTARLSACILSLVLVGCGSGATEPRGGAEGEGEHALPPPLLDVSPGDGGHQIAVLAGGCFWSVEAVFEHVRGVLDVVAGYSGGTAETANYEMVAFAEITDHAEAVEVVFDPTQVTYGQLLRIFFSVAHDPTQVDAQDPDYGRHYRSNIFYRNDEQRRVAEAYIAQIEALDAFSSPIATRLDPLDAFYWAEDEHQDFVMKNPQHGYVQLFSIPKVGKLAALFPQLYEG